MNSRMSLVHSRPASQLSQLTNLNKTNMLLSSMVCNALTSPYSPFSLSNTGSMDSGSSSIDVLCNNSNSSNSLINDDLNSMENNTGHTMNSNATKSSFNFKLEEYDYCKLPSLSANITNTKKKHAPPSGVGNAKNQTNYLN